MQKDYANMTECLAKTYAITNMYMYNDKRIMKNSVTARATCEALVVVYIAQCLAGVTGTNDLVSTAQTLPCTNKVKYYNKCQYTVVCCYPQYVEERF